MMLTKIVTAKEIYFEDEFGKKQGKCIRYYRDDPNDVIEDVSYYVADIPHGPSYGNRPNGTVWYKCNYFSGTFHGEFIRYSADGSLDLHTYDVHGEEVHDFLENPISDEEKMLLVLKYGAPMLPLDSNVD